MALGSLILTDGLGTAPSGGAGVPVISNVSPANGTPIHVNDSIQFDVTEVPPPGLASIFLWVLTSGAVDRLLIFNGSSFQGSFINSTVSIITNGFHFTVRPSPQWGGSIQAFTIEAVDQGGGEVSLDLAWPLIAPNPPNPPVPPGRGGVVPSYKAQVLLGLMPPFYDVRNTSNLWSILTAIGNSDNDIGGQ